jgi:hypothetical protein
MESCWPAGDWLDWNISVSLHKGLAADEPQAVALPDDQQCASQARLRPLHEGQEQEQWDQGQQPAQPPSAEQPQQQGQQQQEQQHAEEQGQQPVQPERRPSIALLANEHPSAGGIYLSNLLCMPRLTLLWQWLTGEWRGVLVGGAAAGERPGRSGGAAEAVGDEPGARPDVHRGWRAVRAEVLMLKVGSLGRRSLPALPDARRASLPLGCSWPARGVPCFTPPSNLPWDRFLFLALTQQAVQRLAASGNPQTNGKQQPGVAPASAAVAGSAGPHPSNPPEAPASAGGQPQQRTAGAVARLVSPPFGGTDWDWLRFWLGWLVAPGVLVALQVVETSSHEPWFVVHVAWLGERRAWPRPDRPTMGAAGGNVLGPAVCLC